MFKITFKVQGTNVLKALEVLEAFGIKTTHFAGEISLEADDYESIHDMVKDLHITSWSAILQS